MNRRIGLVFLGLLLAACASAQDSFLSSLDDCTTLDGTEYVYIEQPLGTTAAKCQTSEFALFLGVALDLGNNGVDESTRIRRIQTANDTNGIFSEAPDDELLIDLALNWPTADLAEALATNGSNCSAGQAAGGVDASGSAEDCAVYATNSFTTITVGTGTSPVADSFSDSLSLTTAGTVGGLSIVGDSSSDSVSFALQQCTENEILKMGVTTWECASDDTGSLSDGDYGDISVGGSGTTLTIDNDAVDEATLKAVDAASDEECLTYETTTGDFEWQACGGGGGGSVALDLDDDASDESSALTEIATTNDNGDAFTEPSADKLLIDVSKLRPPSVLNPRASPHANDCEFSSGVCGSWNLHADFSSGTVDPAAQVSGGDIYDCTSWSGWCLFQDYTASTPAFKPGVYLDFTPATEETWWFHVTAGTGGSSTDENRIGLCYRNSGDTNEAVCFGYHSSGGAERIELYVSNNGGLTSTCVMALGGAGSDDVVMFLQKDTNDYYAGIVRPNGGGAYGNTGTNRSPYYCGVVTKTGVTTFDRMSMMMGDSDDDPTPIQGIDFIRYAASRTFAFVNP